MPTCLVFFLFVLCAPWDGLIFVLFLPIYVERSQSLFIFHLSLLVKSSQALKFPSSQAPNFSTMASACKPLASITKGLRRALSLGDLSVEGVKGNTVLKGLSLDLNVEPKSSQGVSSSSFVLLFLAGPIWFFACFSHVRCPMSAK